LKKKKIIVTLLCIIILMTLFSISAFALTEAELKAQAEAMGKTTVSGNVFIWFLCAIAFLKISQKIDSFMSSLGINVGQTGGSMLGEVIIATRGLQMIKNLTGRGGGASSSSGGSTGSGAASMGFGAGTFNNMVKTPPANNTNVSNSNAAINQNSGNAALSSSPSQNNNITAGGNNQGNLPAPAAGNPANQLTGGNNPAPAGMLPAGQNNPSPQTNNMPANDNDGFLPESSMPQITSDNSSVMIPLENAENSGNMINSSPLDTNDILTGENNTGAVPVSSFEASAPQILNGEPVNSIPAEQPGDNLDAGHDSSPLMTDISAGGNHAEIPSSPQITGENSAGIIPAGQPENIGNSPAVIPQKDNLSAGTNQTVIPASQFESSMPLSAGVNQAGTSPAGKNDNIGGADSLLSSQSESVPMNISHAKIPSSPIGTSAPQTANGNSIGTLPAEQSGSIGNAADVSPQVSNMPAGISSHAESAPTSQHESTTHIISENSPTGISPDGYAGQSGSFGDSADLTPELFVSSMGYTEHAGIPDYSNLQSGDGMITGTETSAANPGGIEFGMYNADQYTAPEGTHTIETAADGSKWYKQYAETPKEQKPNTAQPNGSIAQNQAKPKLPAIPLRKSEVQINNGGKQ